MSVQFQIGDVVREKACSYMILEEPWITTVVKGEGGQPCVVGSDGGYCGVLDEFFELVDPLFATLRKAQQASK